jgi:hypothetical protein
MKQYEQRIFRGGCWDALPRLARVVWGQRGITTITLINYRRVTGLRIARKG